MRLIFVSGFLFCFFFSIAQTAVPLISESEVSRIEKKLASDEMQGRKVFTPGIGKAAAFISGEFKKAGLQPMPGAHDFDQTFSLVDPVATEISAVLDGIPLDKQHIVALTPDSSLTITEADHYKKIWVKTNAEFSDAFYKYFESDQQVLILVDTSMAKRFARLVNRHMPQFAGSGNRIFILTAVEPQQFRIRITQTIKTSRLTNLIGIIPGKSRPEEYVIFSAHYDHLGIGVPDSKGDSIYNGANDDASGVTALITLASYFARLKNNERTLVFYSIYSRRNWRIRVSLFFTKAGS